MVRGEFHNDLLLRTRSDNCAIVAEFRGYIRHVLALENLSDVAEVYGRGALLLRLSHIVEGKLLVVTSGIDLGIV